MANHLRHPRLVWCLLPLCWSRAGAAEVPDRTGPSRIAATQVTLRVGPTRAQGTAIASDGETLTLITAAHFLSDGDVGKPIFLRHAAGPLIGHVESITRNPFYHPVRPRTPGEASAYGTMGVDTEVATVKVDLRSEGERKTFQSIQTAEVTTRQIPGTSGRILPVHIVDQFGEEHVVRAGNHLNPKCLAWGRGSFDVHRGDSGSGVFVLLKTPEGGTTPVLIGNVSQIDDRGGIASLTGREERWLEEALARHQAASGPRPWSATEAPGLPERPYETPSQRGPEVVQVARRVVEDLLEERPGSRLPRKSPPPPGCARAAAIAFFTTWSLP